MQNHDYFKICFVYFSVSQYFFCLCNKAHIIIAWLEHITDLIPEGSNQLVKTETDYSKIFIEKHDLYPDVIID